MKIFKTIISASLLMLLVSCAGFEPLYAENTRVRQHMNQLSVAPIDGRAGFLFGQAMLDRGGVQTGQSGAYVMETTLQKRQAAVGVRVDNVSTRSRLTMRARFTVRDRKGAIVYRGNAESVVAFDEPDQPYGALVAERTAEESATILLAEKALNDLAVFFANLPENS